ncbi:acyltransferase [Plantibacter sp. VKM Ac-2880]|uniref:acyltransferase family protein n=1 Tax=Plantibacter sp. VKM Ac-2880 TaxID=2783827 RepID=UPI00188DF398|nr:acyltransferase [Plantibacter sp. VKM Ac-2880]
MTATNTIAFRPSARISGLDGLRGIAAFVVLVHHSLLLSQPFIEPYRDPRAGGNDGLMWWLTYTPLHLLWDGTVAVFIFFALSGFVLALPARKGHTNWKAYYPARMVRLYLPVWAAVALSFVWAVVPASNRGSDWVQGHVTPAPGGVLRDLILLVEAPGATNSALWSLRWEVLFSLLLPLYVLFAMKLRRWLWLKVAILIALLVVGAYLGPSARPYSLGPLFQLPIFALGCLLAFEWEIVKRSIDRTRMHPVAIAGACALTALLLSSYWLIYAFPFGSDLQDAVAPASRVLQVFGALGLVALVAAVVPFGRVLSTKPLLWLGHRSFSLYLVHEPMVVALGRLLGERASPILTLAISIPVAFVLTELFYRFIEAPSMVLSRRISARVRQRHPRPPITGG